MSDLTPEELEDAKAALHDALASLDGLDEATLDALAHAGDEPEVDELECDHTEARLTDDEWQFVLDLEGTDG